MRTRAAAGVAELSQRGITATLGIRTADLADLETSFLRGLCEVAADFGVEVKHIYRTDRRAARSQPMPVDRQAALEAIPGKQDTGTDYAGMLTAMREYQARHGTDRGPRCSRPVDNDAQDPALLSDWLIGARGLGLAVDLSALVEDPAVHGVICPPPLPPGLSAREDVARIVPAVKDVDGVHPGTVPSLVPGFGIPDDVVLTTVGASFLVHDDVCRLVSGTIALATVAAALRQHAPDHNGSDDDTRRSHT